MLAQHAIDLGDGRIVPSMAHGLLFGNAERRALGDLLGLRLFFSASLLERLLLTVNLTVEFIKYFALEPACVLACQVTGDAT